MSELHKALIEARKSIEHPHFDAENPYFNSKFASLKGCFDAVLPALLDNGITMVQDFETVNDGCVCRTHLLHESGESMVLQSPAMTPTKTDPQGWGSASTYARRYGVMAVMAIVGDKDDDGNKASESAFTSKQAKTKARKNLIEMARNGEDADVRQIWSDLDNDQRAELWDSYAKPDRDLITESLEKTRKE